MSLSNETKVTFYVTVWYITAKKTKLHPYEKESEAQDIYRRTLNKFKTSTEAVFVQIRNSEHKLLGCEFLNYTPVKPTMKRKMSKRK